MIDGVDIAYENEQSNMSARLKNHVRNKLPEMGFCYNYGEPVKTGLFCDGDYWEGHEKRGQFGKIGTGNA